ncbi:gp58-like family protein [Lysinibacillus halotolerans]
MILKIKSKTEELPLGYIQNPERDLAISDTITFSFTTLNHPGNLGYRLVENENIIEYEGHEYRIKQRAKRPKYTNVTAIHIYSDLVGTRRESVLNGWFPLSNLLNFLFEGTGWIFRLLSDKNVYVENFGKNNIVKLMKEICELADIEFVILPNKVIHVADKLSGDFGAIYRYKHNIKSIGEDYDSTSLRTKITGHYKNGSVTYISPYAEVFDEIVADPYTDEEIETKEEMLEILKSQLEDTVKFSMDIEVTDTGPKELGETVHVIHEELGTNLTARVLKIKETLVNNKLVPTSQTVGNYIFEDYTTAVVKQLNKNKTEIQKQASALNAVQQAANGKNSVFRGPDEPTENLQEGDLWYQPTDNGETKMYQYDGTKWVLVIDTSKTTEISNKVDEAFQDAQSAIDAAANAQLRADKANQEAQTALTQAQTSFDTAQNALTQSNNAFANVEALSAKVDTQTGEISTIKHSVSGLETAVANAEGNISTLTQLTNSIDANVKAVDGRVSTLSVSLNGIATRVEDAEDNISSLTVTTSGLQSKVANAENNISTLTQTASVLQTRMSDAEGNINKLTITATSLTSRIDNLQVGGRNYLLNTSPELFSLNNWFPYGASYMQLFKSGDYLAVKCTVDNSSATVGVYSGANQNSNVTCYLNEWYTLSFDAYLDSAVSVNTLELNYIYIMSKVGNFSISASGYGAIIITKEKKRVSISFKINSGSADRTPVGILIGTRRLTLGDIFYVKNIKLEKGNMATDWSPAPEDTDSEFDTVYSQITQLNNNINLKVSKNDVVNQINVSTEGILINGSKVHITGTTTIDNGVIKSAMIASLSADKITTGTLNAANVNVINLNASSIVSGTLNANSVTFGNSKIKADSTGLYVYKNSVLGASLVEGNLSFYNQTTGALIGRFAATVWENTTYTGISMNVQHDKYISFGHYVDSTVGYLSILTIAPTAFAGVPQGINTGLDLRLGGDIWAGAWAVRFGRNNTHNHSTIWHVDDNLAIGSYGMLRLGTFTSGAVLNDRFTISSTVLDAYRDLDMHGWKLLRVGEIQTSNWARLAAVSNMGYLQHDYGISITKYQSSTYAPIAASAFNVSSSRDYKTNIKELDYSALSVINGLKVVEYDLISNIEDGIDDRQVGLIAEDSLSVATIDGRAINTYKLTAYHTRAIQEISSIQQDELLTRAKLEMEIATLKSEVAKLKEQLGAA